MLRQFFENIRPGTLLFSRFTMVRLLSAWEFGGVYLCEDRERLGNHTVLKVVYKTPLNPRSSLKRELELTQQVHSNHTIQAYYFFEDDEFQAFSMEYLEGGSLAHYLEVIKPLPIRRSCEVLAQLVRGIADVHRANLVHRDLKPENILIAHGRLAKITDFGIATPIGEQVTVTDESLTGTIDYLSPEYIAQGLITPAADIYSIGVIAFQMLSGQLPFEGQDIVDLLARRASLDSPNLRDLAPEYSAELARVIDRALARDYRKRFPDGEALLHELYSCGAPEFARRETDSRLAAA